MSRIKHVLSGCLLASMLALQPGSAQVSVSIGFNTFQGGLAPYGQWVTVAHYGTVWQPTVAATWHPYTYGHWVHSNVGWVWASSEPWGWATYHYGRWAFEPSYGWVWVPGAVWAPAWVSWYVGPSYVGWYPMGPPGYAIPGPAYATFVPFHNFMSVNIAAVMLPPAQNFTYVNRTAFLNNVTVVNHNWVNPGPSVGSVQHAWGHPVPQVNVVSQHFNPNNLAAHGAQASQLRGNTFYAFQPRVQAPPPGTSAPLMQSEARGHVWTGTHNVTYHPAFNARVQSTVPSHSTFHTTTPQFHPAQPNNGFHASHPGYNRPSTSTYKRPPSNSHYVPHIATPQQQHHSAAPYQEKKHVP